MDKRGLSPVIAVVLLIMITVVAASLIVAFLMPFIRESLKSGQECFEIIDDLTIADTGFNCYDTAADKTSFSVRIDDEKIIGFTASLISAGSSDGKDIINQASIPGITMLDGTSPLSVPARGGVRTYSAAGSFDKVEIYPILESGAKCNLADSVEINPC